MFQLLRSRASLIWFLLIAATAMSYVMGHGLGFTDLRAAGVAIIVITFIKVRYVMLDFMELRGAPWGVRLTGEGWCLGLTIALSALFLQVGH